MVIPEHQGWPRVPSSAETQSIHDAWSTPNQDAGRPLRILVVDDERLIADTLAYILNQNGFTAKAAYSGEAALALVSELCPDILLTDVHMPGRDGIETAMLMREQCPDLRVVLLSGQVWSSGGIEEVEQSAGFELWPKPIHPHELVQRLRAHQANA